jgi:hypothetical protein
MKLTVHPHLMSMTRSKFPVAPISIAIVGSLKTQGHIVGLNGNWAVVVQTVPLWHRIFSFASGAR